MRRFDRCVGLTRSLAIYQLLRTLSARSSRVGSSSGSGSAPLATPDAQRRSGDVDARLQ
jgi:hypothetical protein